MRVTFKRGRKSRSRGGAIVTFKREIESRVQERERASHVQERERVNIFVVNILFIVLWRELDMKVVVVTVVAVVVQV